jgi:diguanylate cyclase (GGDEF)-like protein
LLNNTALDDAKVIAEKISAIIENAVFTYNAISIQTTVSIGLSDLNTENTSIEDLYKQADKHLYMAKESGRNRVSS